MKVSGIRAEIKPLLNISSIFIPKVRDMLGLLPRMEEYGIRAVINHREFVASGGKSNSLFARFFDPKRNQELSDSEIAMEAANFIIAGSDTTTMTLTYLCWALIRPENAEPRSKLIKEIENVPYNAPASQLESLPYLQAAIKEGLRLYSAVGTTMPRKVPPEGAMLGGYYFPPGTVVGNQAYTLHRNPEVFPEPERSVL